MDHHPPSHVYPRNAATPQPDDENPAGGVAQFDLQGGVLVTEVPHGGHRPRHRDFFTGYTRFDVQYVLARVSPQMVSRGLPQ